ncbi:MAG TPA: hypothetical protein VFT55_01800, partial [Planctomycetota bacterium]|nr:hypothetical protein [Planctomycetota bacterium]
MSGSRGCGRPPGHRAADRRRCTEHQRAQQTLPLAEAIPILSARMPVPLIDLTRDKTQLAEVEAAVSRV